MNLAQRIPTRPWLWALVSALLFVGAGFIDFFPALNKGGGLQYWRTWQAVFANGLPLSMNLAGMAILTVALAAPCVLLGWALHCLIVLAWEARPGRRRRAEPAVAADGGRDTAS
jgi:hypothetical protein